VKEGLGVHCETVDWIQLAQDGEGVGATGMCEHCHEPA